MDTDQYEEVGEGGGEETGHEASVDGEETNPSYIGVV